MATTTTSCKRIELSYLKEHKMLVKGEIVSSILSWTDESRINLTVYYTDTDKYLQLDYTIDNNLKKSYQVQFIEKPSNLGKGQVIYIVCPFSGGLCRKLYLAYGSTQFKSIKAYDRRIYYRGQLSPSTNYNDKYWSYT